MLQFLGPMQQIVCGNILVKNDSKPIQQKLRVNFYNAKLSAVNKLYFLMYVFYIQITIASEAVDNL